MTFFAYSLKCNQHLCILPKCNFFSNLIGNFSTLFPARTFPSDFLVSSLNLLSFLCLILHLHYVPHFFSSFFFFFLSTSTSGIGVKTIDVIYILRPSLIFVSWKKKLLLRWSFDEKEEKLTAVKFLFDVSTRWFSKV